MKLLESLTSNDFLLELWHIATPPALHRALIRSEQVNKIKLALKSGQLTEDEIRKFSDDLSKSIQKGVPFEHDLTIAAIAVALSDRPTTFADEYLRDLAKLKLAEMPMSIRVARECLDKRQAMATTTSTIKGSVIFEVPPKIPFVVSYEELAAWRFPGLVTGQSQSRSLIGCV